jgi:hypothetical protein
MVNPIPPSPSPSLDFEHIEIEDTYDSSRNVSYELTEKEREDMDKPSYEDIENQINIPRTDIENVEIVLEHLNKSYKEMKKKFSYKVKNFFVNCCEYCSLCMKEYRKKF